MKILTQPPSAKRVEEQDPKAKRKKLLYKVGGVFAFFLLFIFLFMPPMGSLQYGICKTFVELSESYPNDVKALSVDDYISLGGPVKMTYKRIDPFGVESVNTIECYFKMDQNGNVLNELEKIDINGKARIYNAENQDYVQKFNSGISAIIESGPDLSLPLFSLDNLSEYKNNQ